MATTDELKKKDGSAVGLGAVRLAPKEREELFAQIPTGGTGTGPTPQPDPTQSASGTELGRNVNNAINAIPAGALGRGIVTGGAKIADALVGSEKVGRLAAGALKVGPYAVPAAGVVGLGMASSQSAGALPSAPTPSPAGALPTTPVQPLTQAPPLRSEFLRSGTAANVAASKQMDSGSAYIPGNGEGMLRSSSGNIIKLNTSNDRYAPQSEASLRAQYAPTDYRREDAVRDAPTTLRAEPTSWVDELTATCAARQNADRAVTLRDQDIQAGATRANYQMAQERLKLDAAQEGRDATVAGFASRSAGRIEALQAAYEAAKPEDKAGLAEQLRVLTGKDKPAHWKAIALQGATDAMGNKTEGVMTAVNEQTGEVKRLDQGGTQAKVPHAQDIARLKANPGEVAMFEQIYGAGAAKQYLGK